MIWRDSSLALQAVQQWTLNQDNPIQREIVWESPQVYEEIAARHGETLEEYCDKFDMVDWRDYCGEELLLRVNCYGIDIPQEEVQFRVPDHSP